jgi:ABC-type lipoprotein release transport system permease subunit
MGTDVPPAILSRLPRSFFDYFNELFAQVTNPPIDALRESMVTSNVLYLGNHGNLLEDSRDNCRTIRLDSPILSQDDFERIRSTKGVAATTCYIEQSVMASANGHRTTVALRGIDTNYCKVIPIDKHLTLGDMNRIKAGDVILSATVASELAVYSMGATIELYALNRKQISTLLPTSGISRYTSHLGGEVVTNTLNDATLALGELSRVQRLLNYEGKLSCLAIKCAKGADAEAVKQVKNGEQITLFPNTVCLLKTL